MKNMLRIALLAGALAGCLAATPAQAQHGSWLIPHLSGFYTQPSPALDNVPTTLVLWGWFGYLDGEVTDANVIDPSHVELTLRPRPAGSDTIETWHHPFELGLLAAGYHPVHVKITFVDTDQSVTVSEGDFSFEVVDHTYVPPPPPPQEPPSWLFRGLSGFITVPASPNNFEPTTLTLWGWFPYDCGQVTDVSIGTTTKPTDHLLRLTLRPGPACEDTARIWHQPYSLGLLEAGEHTVTVEMTAVGDPADSVSGTSTRVGSFGLSVSDGVTSPAPPAPVDSLGTPGQPNPFTLMTKFKVSLEAATSIEVGIFDLAGREIVNLHRGFAPAGVHEFAWNGRREDGTRAQSGVYFYRVAAPGKTVARRLVLLPKP